MVGISILLRGHMMTGTRSVVTKAWAEAHEDDSCKKKLKKKKKQQKEECTKLRALCITWKPCQLESQQQSDLQQLPKHTQASSSHATTCPEKSTRHKHKNINTDLESVPLARASLDTHSSADADMPRLAG